MSLIKAMRKRESEKRILVQILVCNISKTEFFIFKSISVKPPPKNNNLSKI